MVFNETTAIDISSASENEIDVILDKLYDAGYLTPQGSTPAYWELEDYYYDRNGVVPCFLVCYCDAAGGSPVVEAADKTSPRSQRLLANARVLSVPRATMMLSY